MLAKNIKYLRKKNRISQAEMADILGLKRTTLGDYERSTSNPSILTLVQISEYFNVSVDQLLKDKIFNDHYAILNNSSQKVLAISIDPDGKNNIELVKTKAEAGYLSSFNDPEYIRDLPKISLPNIDDGTYRAFEINGDSMLPIISGSIIVCSYIESLDEIKDNNTYIVISKSDGLVYKRIKKDTSLQKLILISDNEHYLPYEIGYDDIAELWKYHAHISFSDEKITNEDLRDKLNFMENQLAEIKEKLFN